MAGAEIGAWAKYLESSKETIAKLPEVKAEREGNLEKMDDCLGSV